MTRQRHATIRTPSTTPRASPAAVWIARRTLCSATGATRADTSTASVRLFFNSRIGNWTDARRVLCTGLAGVPDGDWFCARCDDSSSNAAKASTTAEKAHVNANELNTTPVKRGPGRPRKRPLEEPSSPAPSTPSPTKRGPGRPRSSPNPSTPPSTVQKNVRPVKVVNQKVVQQDIRDAFATAKRSARSAAPKPGAMALPVRAYKRRDGVGA